jgi:hypothetical protein
MRHSYVHFLDIFHRNDALGSCRTDVPPVIFGSALTISDCKSSVGGNKPTGEEAHAQEDPDKRSTPSGTTDGSEPSVVGYVNVNY